MGKTNCIEWEMGNEWSGWIIFLCALDLLVSTLRQYALLDYSQQWNFIFLFFAKKSLNFLEFF
jgi:hypothetical protein